MDNMLQAGNAQVVQVVYLEAKPAEFEQCVFRYNKWPLHHAELSRSQGGWRNTQLSWKKVGTYFICMARFIFMLAKEELKLKLGDTK